MKVFTDLITGEEFFSDAKVLEPVTWKDPETGEDVDTGLVRCAAAKQTAGGIKIAGIGGSGAGAGMGGTAEVDEEGGGDDGEEAEETKLDQFWNFPSIENEHTFSSFADFKKNYFMPFLVAWSKMAVDKGLAKDDADMKAKGKKMNGATGKWLKAHYDELQFYGPEVYFMDGSEVSDKYAGSSFTTNFAFVKYEGTNPFFYFIKVRAEERERGGAGAARPAAAQSRAAQVHPTDTPTRPRPLSNPSKICNQTVARERPGRRRGVVVSAGANAGAW